MPATFTLEQLDAEIQRLEGLATGLRLARNALASRASAPKLPERVLALLGDGETYAPRFVAHALQADYNCTSNTLLRLARKGLLSRVGRGQFRLAASGQTQAEG
jgi:hypothetical protein